MGYTHYFEIARSLTGEEFESLAMDAARIVAVAEQHGIRLCGDYRDPGSRGRH